MYQINDDDIREEYSQRLIELEIIVINAEETAAKEAVENAEDYLEYYWYKSALEKTNILTNKELKDSLLERLEVVKEELTEIELEKYEDFKMFNYILIFVTVVFIIYIYNLHDKEYPNKFNQHYLREIPNQYSPSTVTYLFKHTINSDSVSAEVLKLINDGKIFAEKNSAIAPDTYHNYHYCFRLSSSDAY